MLGSIIYHEKKERVNNDAPMLFKMYHTQIPKEQTKKEEVIVILRGHIRDGFENDKMYNFIKKILEISPIKLYIHTWIENNGKQSWKNYDKNFEHVHNTSIVTDTLIKDYFREIPIEYILIENDEQIQINGEKTGFICMSKCPIIAWKNMWHGIFTIFNLVFTLDTSCSKKTIQTRLDLFSTTNSCTKMFNENMIWNKVKTYILYENVDSSPAFLINKLKPGIDNIIFGNFMKLYNLVSLFNKDLDMILSKYRYITHQEYLVPLVSNLMFNERNNISSSS
jgi:hypothetical protein